MTRPLSEFTTLRVGGSPRALHQSFSMVDLVNDTRNAWDTDEPCLILAGGSNVVIADEPFDGHVIHVATSGIEHVHGSDTLIRVQAGEPWDNVVAYTVEH